MNKYPECDKVKDISDISQKIGEFIEWLKEKNYIICKKEIDEEYGTAFFHPTYLPMEETLAEFFNIDLNKLEEERRNILEEFRKKCNGE